MRSSSMPLTEKQTIDEMIRLLEILLYRKIDKEDEDDIKSLLKKNFEYRGELLARKAQEKFTEQVLKNKNK